MGTHSCCCCRGQAHCCPAAGRVAARWRRSVASDNVSADRVHVEAGWLQAHALPAACQRELAAACGQALLPVDLCCLRTAAHTLPACWQEKEYVRMTKHLEVGASTPLSAARRRRRCSPAQPSRSQGRPCCALRSLSAARPSATTSCLRAPVSAWLGHGRSKRDRKRRPPLLQSSWTVDQQLRIQHACH